MSRSVIFRTPFWGNSAINIIDGFKASQDQKTHKDGHGFSQTDAASAEKQTDTE